MKRAIEIVEKYYSDISWQLEMYFQTAYVLMVLSGVFVTWRFLPEKAIFATVFIGIHLLLLYTVGYKKMCWEGDKKEVIYQNIFRAIQIFVVAIAIWLDWYFTLVIMGVLLCIMLWALVLHLIANNIICVSAFEDKVNCFIHKFKLAFYLLIMGMPALIFIGTLLLLPLDAITMVGIVLITALLIPFIAEMHDSGITLHGVAIDRTWSKELLKRDKEA